MRLSVTSIGMIRLILIIAICLSSNALAYDIEADFIDPNAMVFQVGQLIDGDGGGGISFRSFPPIFWMRVSEDNNPDDDPDEVAVLVRLEVAQGGPIFTVSSRSFDIRRVLIPRGRMTNQQLAMVPELAIGQGDDLDVGQLGEHIEGGMLREGLYVLTVIVCDRDLGTSDWNRALNDNFGIRSATVRTRSPGQVELLNPRDTDEIATNPNFAWRFPRNPGVEFQLEIVTGDANDDPSNALDFANDQTRCLDKTITLPPSASGDRTTYNYSGTGEERALENGNTYFWRVTANAPSMIAGQPVTFQSVPYTFSYRVQQQQRQAEIFAEQPSPGATVEDNPPSFGWRLENGNDVSRFELSVYNSNNPDIALRNMTIQGRGRSRVTFNAELLWETSYNWTISAVGNDGQELAQASSDFRMGEAPDEGPGRGRQPLQIALTNPDNNATLRRANLPEFSWEVTGNGSPSDVIFRLWRSGNQDGTLQEIDLRPQDRSYTSEEPLAFLGGYEWMVRLRHGNRTINSEIRGFNYNPDPQIEIQSPKDDAQINLDLPEFTWTSRFLPDSWMIQVNRTTDGGDEAFSSKIVSVGSVPDASRPWEFSENLNDGLRVGEIYRWRVAGVLDGGDRVETDFETFVYPLPTVTLADPEYTRRNDNPVFRWAFDPDLPDGATATFTIVVKNDDDETVGSAEVDDSEWRYDGDALNRGDEYVCTVTAKITQATGAEHSITSNVLRFEQDR